MGVAFGARLRLQHRPLLCLLCGSLLRLVRNALSCSSFGQRAGLGGFARFTRRSFLRQPTFFGSLQRAFPLDCEPRRRLSFERLGLFAGARRLNQGKLGGRTLLRRFAGSCFSELTFARCTFRCFSRQLLRGLPLRDQPLELGALRGCPSQRLAGGKLGGLPLALNALGLEALGLSVLPSEPLSLETLGLGLFGGDALRL
jgi:hypothetical protein